MGFRFLLDENVERAVGTRLERAGHDVEHVDSVSELGKGATDRAIGAYSLEADRVIVTYDDDFVLSMDESAFSAVLYVGDETLSPDAVATILDAIATVYPQSELSGVEYVGDEWL